MYAKRGVHVILDFRKKIHGGSTYDGALTGRLDGLDGTLCACQFYLRHLVSL
jgi:hypothetical protein